MKSEDLSKFDSLVVTRLKRLLASRYRIVVKNEKEDVLDAASKFDAADLNELLFALRRIEKGTYGQCVICRHDIPVDVLEANLTARLCPSCQMTIQEKTDPSIV